ncbi:MAG: DUF5320 domain-containing protein [bacterium]|nr:DUF5320 domain-containing protein [bacterium]
MAGGNKRGPLGAGPMTGRKAGRCTGNATPGYTSSGRGNFFRRRNRRGPGFGNKFNYRFFKKESGEK